MVLRLKKAGEVFAVPRGSLTRGQIATFLGVVPNAVDDLVLGIVMDDAATNDPLSMVDLYGNGSIVDDSTLTLDEDSIIYSAGDGTYTITEPAGAAGTNVVVLGYAVSPTAFRVDVSSFELGA